MTDAIQPGSSPEPGGDEWNDEDLAFSEWMARPLRAPERLDVTFEARVMSAVHAEARAGGAPHARGARTRWWLRSRTLRISPVVGFAAAAGFAGIVLAAAEGARSLASRFRAADSSVMAEPQAPDTIYLVRFVFVDAAARSVSLVGDFNGWTKRATPMLTTSSHGVWTVSVPLAAGRHEYAFIVDDATGERWVADPFAAVVRDEFDTESSLVVVGAGEDTRLGTS